MFQNHSIAVALVASLALAAVPGLSRAATPSCTSPEIKVSWPANAQPIWEFCVLSPGNSSGPRGSGLEIRKAYFRGVPVLKRAHAPILFAEYRTDQGANGNCYRDWKDENSSFAMEPAVRNTLGSPTGFFATGNCDVSTAAVQSFGSCPFNGNPVRSFAAADCAAGVAIENAQRNNFVQLTTQYSAGWYKYASRFRLYNDGSIDAEFGFGNADGTYNNATHWHQNYWRFDFDLDGPANDVLFVNDQPQTTEFALKRVDGPTVNTFKIADSVKGFGYTISPGASDNATPATQSGRTVGGLPMHAVDVIGTLYKAAELSDRSNNTLGDCRMVHENLANGESIANADTVVYYRASVRDSTANDTLFPGIGPGPGGQDSMICKRVGPSIIPTGDWPLFRGDFEIGT